MIRVTKPSRPPAVLLTRGAAATRRLHERFDSGERSFGRFDARIYAHPTVTEALRKAQHDKCCFCERKTKCDVEHFRPKSGCQQQREEPLSQPGYYWLAYEWANLLLACATCNGPCKNAVFPLVDPARRALCHHDDVRQEQPLLIDPATEDPAEHIGFNRAVAVAIDSSPRGQATIDCLQLNRIDLLIARRCLLDMLGLVVRNRDALQRKITREDKRGEKVSKQDRELLRRNEQMLEKHQRNSAEFAAMARAYLGGVAPRIGSP